MTNTVHEIQQWVADTLNADQWLRERDVAAYAENQLDIEAKVQRALDGVGIVATVLTPAINYTGTDADGAICSRSSATTSSRPTHTKTTRWDGG